MGQIIYLGSSDSLGNGGVNNKVGIGTSNPSTRLQVSGASNSIAFEVDDTYPRIIFSGNSPVINWTSSAHYYMGETNYTGNVLIRTGGKVGISTTSPTEKLDVVGNIKASGDINAGGDLKASGDLKITGTFVAGRLVLGNYYIWVDTNGKLRIKNGMPMGSGEGDVVGSQVGP